MSRVKAVFLLPIRDNDGRGLEAEISETMGRVYECFGGWTADGAVQGVFRMSDGSRSDDQSLRYFVFLDDGRIDELIEILRQFKSLTTQEAIYLEIQRNIEVKLV